MKKIDERSVIAFGYLTLTGKTGLDSESLSDDEQIIFNTHVSKQVEYLFTSGEALVVAAAGWNSKLLQTVDIPDATVEYIPHDTSRVAALLNNILAACRNTQPSLRKQVVFGYCLLQYCNNLDAVRSKAAEIHVAFMRFLADRDNWLRIGVKRVGVGL